MTSHVTITREIAPLPPRANDAHKGDVGRVLIIGGCCGEVWMVGAPAFAALAALRSGAGLVQMLVPQAIRTPAVTVAPGATVRTLPVEAPALLDAIHEFGADVIALGPGLGRSIEPGVIADLLTRYEGPWVVDADGLNRLAEVDPFVIPEAHRVVLTPHPGEARRLLAARNVTVKVGRTEAQRREAACALVEAYGCTIVLKGAGTVVTNGDRLYVNHTGNAGMATGGTGDVLTGIIAALVGQKMPPLEAAILGVYLHGLAGDFAAEELGRRSLIATDLIEYLPEAFGEHEATGQD